MCRHRDRSRSRHPGTRRRKSGNAKVSESSRVIQNAAIRMTTSASCRGDVGEPGASRPCRELVRAMRGIVSQADLALAARQEKEVTDREVALVVERISEPSQRSNSRAGQRLPNGDCSGLQSGSARGFAPGPHPCFVIRCRFVLSG